MPQVACTLPSGRKWPKVLPAGRQRPIRDRDNRNMVTAATKTANAAAKQQNWQQKGFQLRPIQLQQRQAAATQEIITGKTATRATEYEYQYLGACK